MPLERAWWRRARVEVAATPPEMAWGLGPDRHQIGPHDGLSPIAPYRHYTAGPD